MLLGVGLNNIRDLHGAAIDKSWLGTDSTAVAESQTGLQAGVADSKLAVTITAEDKTNIINYTLPSATAQGNTFREFAAIDDGTVEYSRDVFTGIEHTANDDIVVRKTFFYRNP